MPVVYYVVFRILGCVIVFDNLESVAYARFLKGGGGGKIFRKFEINENQNENFPAQNQVRFPART